MKVLVIGSGGREHALAFKISKSPLVKKIYTAPGNGGTCSLSKNENVALKPTDIKGLTDFALDRKIDLTVVGPEDPLCMGIVDEFEKKGLNIFGPKKNAAMLEASKGFAKNFMKENSIPSPGFTIVDSFENGKREIEKLTPPIVLKADGLALGKGVKICPSTESAVTELKDMMINNAFGDAGKKVIIDEFIDGMELSYIALCDGNNILPLATSQDNKRLLDNDEGPNTGGMGAYSPIPSIAKENESLIVNEVMKKTLTGMAHRGSPFSGALYAGLIYKGDKPLVLEYNVRFGDPETQPLLFRMKSDIVPVLMASAKGDLSKEKIEWEDCYSICIVMASGGYPQAYKKGLLINGPLDINENDENAIVFHAGTRMENNNIYTSGGRVLGICVKDKDFLKAKEKALNLAKEIHFENAHFRKDIGEKIIKML